MKKTKQHLFFFLVPLAIIFLYLATRLYVLDTVPVFVDEAIYVRWSQVMRNEPSLRFLPQSDGKQPLFMWLTIPFFKLISDPLIAGRMVSVVSGLGTLIGIGFLTFLLTKSKKLALLSSFIYSITPFTVFFDRMSLVDSTLAMFGVWSLVFGYLFVKTSRLDMAMFLGFSIGGGLLTKSPAVFFYIWQVLLLVFYFPLKQIKNKQKILNYIAGYVLVILISQAMFNILRLGENFNMINSRNQDYIFSFSEVLTHPLNPLVGNLKTTIKWLLDLFTISLIGLASISFFRTKSKKISYFILVISLVVFFAQGLVAKVYTPRYILFASIPLIILSALGLDFICKKIKGKSLSLTVGIIILIFPILRTLNYITKPKNAVMPEKMRSGYFQMWTSGVGQKQVATYLINTLSSFDSSKTIVIGTEGYFGTLPDGLKIYTQNYPQIRVIGVGTINTIPPALTNSLADKNNDIYLLVNKTRNHIPAKDLDKLELISQYPKLKSDKEISPNIYQEILQFYKLKRE